MEIKKRRFNSLNIDPLVYFHGTLVEQKQAQRKEDKAYERIRKIIFSKGFRAMSYVNDYGQTRVLCHSTRPGCKYVINYIDSDGVPAMHECFIERENEECDWKVHNEREMIKHFLDRIMCNPMTVEVLYDQEGKMSQEFWQGLSEDDYKQFARDICWMGYIRCNGRQMY